jgi:ATP-dependent metalloprotease
VLQSDRAFELYLAALVKNGLESSVNAAVRRRDGILASVTAATTGPSPSASSPEVSSVSTSEPAAVSQKSTSPPPIPTRSEMIAQKVLAGGTLGTSASIGSRRLDNAQFAAALASGAGISGNPIHVTVAECKCNFYEWEVGLLIVSLVF